MGLGMLRDPIHASFMSAPSRRLTQLDALRGLAALAVVLFHYTHHFFVLYPSEQRPVFALPNGHFGVNLFFIISGFVIFMTLENTRRAADFIVSRFSRLYPAYWVAIALTFAITHWLGLPGKLVELPTALANLLMFHSLFGVPNVDGVYWTLEVELLFYCMMFALYRTRQLGHVHRVLWGLLALRLLYLGLERGFGIDLPWTLARLLILKYIAWFALGIAIYQTTRERPAGRAPLATALLAIVTLAIGEAPQNALLGIAFATVVWLAAKGRIAMFAHPLFVWLGAISYPLYLLHENIGWSALLELQRRGLDIHLAIALTTAASLALATALSVLVERPAMDWIRARYKARQR